MNSLMIRLLGAVTLITAFSANAEVLFQEDFDDQPDWTSGGLNEALNYATDTVIPRNWTAIRQSSTWHPGNGNPDNHDSIEILASNSDKARGGQGKSFVVWRESLDRGASSWVADAILNKHLPGGHDELYVSFWIRFSPDWTTSSGQTTKMFRIYSWNEVDPITKFFGGGGSGPIFLWDYEVSNYGVRNRWSLRGGPHGENYTMDSLDGFPRSLNGWGDASLNYGANTRGMAEDGSDPKIPNQVDGGYLSDNFNRTYYHEHVYGPLGTWMKMAFYVKMNSAPGVKDGVVKQWLNDTLIMQSKVVPWTGPTSNAMPKWNVVAFGGNSYFPTYPEEDKHEEWYSIDDIYVATSIPENLGGTAVASPNPPSDVDVTVSQ